MEWEDAFIDPSAKIEPKKPLKVMSKFVIVDGDSSDDSDQDSELNDN